MAVWEGLYVVVSVSGEGSCPNPSHWSNGWSESYPPSNVNTTISIKHTWANTMSHIHTTMFFWSPLSVQALFSTTVHSHLFSICVAVFSLGRLLTGHWSQAPAFQKCSKSSIIAKAIVSAKSPSWSWWNIASWKCFFFLVVVVVIKAMVQHLPLIGAILEGVLAMCSVPSQIVLISKILRSWDWMLWQSWADKMHAWLHFCNFRFQ